MISSINQFTETHVIRHGGQCVTETIFELNRRNTRESLSKVFNGYNELSVLHWGMRPFRIAAFVVLSSGTVKYLTFHLHVCIVPWS